MMARISVAELTASDIGVFSVSSHWLVAPLALADILKVGKAVSAEVAALIFAHRVVALTLVAVGWGI